ncbi:hypothetical protein [Grimontia sp. SpTr1]|uniref:hypothetical protein n=1 Tax=Grimontia sp. SpTr1 TaxID=2995319 RepID=UPI00248AE2DF|nr:hypothetical protein [Grimontia sp. SpTr1]
MKMSLKSIYLSLFSLVLIAGCSSSQKAPSVDTTEKFQIKEISLKLIERVTPEITYHTANEIENRVSSDIKGQLKKANLISSDPTMNTLKITMTYHRRFAGDQTPFPSDSLIYPNFDYDIEIYDGNDLLTTISKRNLTYSGGFKMNLEVLGGSLRSKEDEIVFFNALSNTIIDRIKSLN